LQLGRHGWRRRARGRSVGPLWAAVVLLAARSSFGATAVLAPSDDTFINSGNPANNNGGSSSLFTGTDGHGGLMRALVRFAMPAGLQGRATVTGARLQLTVRELPNNTIGPAALETLARVTQPWAQGNGSGELPGTITVGLACGGTITGATWNQTNCATAVAWTTAGGSVTAPPSGQADTTGVAADAAVTWDSVSNPAMLADVQSWLDTPASNDGWRLASNTEGAPSAAQRFYATEAGAFGPSLSVTFTCKAGFVDNGARGAAVGALASRRRARGGGDRSPAGIVGRHALAALTRPGETSFNERSCRTRSSRPCRNRPDW
jgi:hypothetical protein